MSKKPKPKSHQASASHRSSQAGSDSSIGASRGKGGGSGGQSCSISSSSAVAPSSGRSASSSRGPRAGSRSSVTGGRAGSPRTNKSTSTKSCKTNSNSKQQQHRTKVGKSKGGGGPKQVASSGKQTMKEAEDESEGMSIFRKDPKMQALLERKHYVVLKRIAHGAFGQVYKGAKTDDRGRVQEEQLIAIKVIEMARLQLIFREKYLPQELAALTHLNHKNIVRVHDIFRANERLYIAMEFAPNGDLSGWLKKNGPMKERLAAYWFAQVVAALSYVHASLRMAHRDVKLDNVLLDANHDAKLSDFGFAKECWDSKRHCVILSQTICGTQPYFSPQLVDHVPYNAYMADVWAMGVMCFVMLNYRFPFHFEQEPAVWLLEMTNWPTFVRTRFTPTISAKAVDLVVAMLNPDEKARMTLHEALKHEWLAKVADKSAPIDA